jgi:hypothetical protein
MSDYFYGTGYDAGAVVEMNNLAIGYFPRSHVACPAVISPGQAQVPILPPQAVPAIPAAESETKS